MRKLLLLLTLVVCPLALAEGPIQDNSFLIEEAYNQEPGVVQHIFTFSRSRSGAWVSTFTQEWPATSQQHQLSYTIPLQSSGLASGVGDVLINYRYQAAGSGESRIAFSPRVSAILPTGSRTRGLGAGHAGIQLMLPVSTVLSPHFVWHANLGTSVTPGRHLRQDAAGQSLVWLAHPRVNPLVEVLWTRNSQSGNHDDTFIVSPGVRWSYDLAHNLQIVPGVAFPITVGSNGDRSVFIYFSAEHPFRAN